MGVAFFVYRGISRVLLHIVYVHCSALISRHAFAAITMLAPSQNKSRARGRQAMHIWALTFLPVVVFSASYMRISLR
jgi:hypothetical protein